MELKKKVIIAMSGGVDSSVAAGLLVEQGYEVIGMMLKLWADECESKENACCTPESINQAREVASQLKIPFYVIDCREVFKQCVVNPFIQDYQNGFTPNPCFVCNQKIKWGFLLNKALQFGADYLASGHYAQIKIENNKIRLFKGCDEQKDQSYVLSGLTQEQLRHTILPLGKYTKAEVRKMAERFGLKVASKPDSQDLCFVGNQGYRAFLQKYSSTENCAGLIRNKSGDVVGQHNGLSSYTIGQRKGLGSGFPVPQYVLEKIISRNELIIGTADQLGTRNILISNLNWINEPLQKGTFSCWVKIRYKSKPMKCTVDLIKSDSIMISFEEKVRDATPGQIAVLYNNDEVIGSGVILNAEGE